MAHAPEDNNLSLPEAAARLGVSRHTLRTWSVYQRRLPFLRLGRRVLFRRRDIEAFEARALVPASSLERRRVR
jgi:excisionase family DNA binding protein